jgi:hypothetical protein
MSDETTLSRLKKAVAARLAYIATSSRTRTPPSQPDKLHELRKQILGMRPERHQRVEFLAPRGEGRAWGISIYD